MDREQLRKMMELDYHRSSMTKTAWDFTEGGKRLSDHAAKFVSESMCFGGIIVTQISINLFFQTGELKTNIAYFFAIPTTYGP